MQSQLLPDGTEGLNSEEVAKMDGEKRTFPTRFSPSLPHRAVAIAGPACLFIESFHSCVDWVGAFKQTWVSGPRRAPCFRFKRALLQNHQSVDHFIMHPT